MITPYIHHRFPLQNATAVIKETLSTNWSNCNLMSIWGAAWMSGLGSVFGQWLEIKSCVSIDPT